MDEKEYPRVLNGDGCIYGQICSEKVIEAEERINEIEEKIDKLLWALMGMMISLVTAIITMWVNCLIP